MSDKMKDLNASYFKYIIDTICRHHDEKPYSDSEVGCLVRSILGEYIMDV